MHPGDGKAGADPTSTGNPTSTADPSSTADPTAAPGRAPVAGPAAASSAAGREAGALPPGVPPEAAGWLAERPPHELSDPLQELLILARALRFAMATRLGISETELHAMEHLITEPMGPVELSRRLELTSAAATVLLHRLEESGHVRRRPHPTDRRRQLVVPRPEGLGAVFKQLKPLLTRLDEVALSFDEADREVIARYLEAVNAALRETIDEWRSSGT